MILCHPVWDIHYQPLLFQSSLCSVLSDITLTSFKTPAMDSVFAAPSANDSDQFVPWDSCIQKRSATSWLLIRSHQLCEVWSKCWVFTVRFHKSFRCINVFCVVIIICLFHHCFWLIVAQFAQFVFYFPKSWSFSETAFWKRRCVSLIGRVSLASKLVT